MLTLKLTFEVKKAVLLLCSKTSVSSSVMNLPPWKITSLISIYSKLPLKSLGSDHNMYFKNRNLLKHYILYVFIVPLDQFNAPLPKKVWIFEITDPKLVNIYDWF